MFISICINNIVHYFIIIMFTISNWVIYSVLSFYPNYIHLLTFVASKRLENARGPKKKWSIYGTCLQYNSSIGGEFISFFNLHRHYQIYGAFCSGDLTKFLHPGNPKLFFCYLPLTIALLKWIYQSAIEYCTTFM